MWRLILTLVVATAAVSAIVIPPEDTSGEKHLAVVIVQGAFVSPEQYVEMGKTMQNVSTSPLWVGIAEGFIDNTPNPLQIGSAINHVLGQMSDAGMPDDASISVAGHSLGGVFIPSYVKSHSKSLAAMLMFGSYLTGESLGEFPTPVLHLSGTLDGQTRCTRIAHTFSELQILQAQNATSALLKPVLLLEGVNHAHFFTGPLPSSVAENDILSELSGETGRHMLAEKAVTFMEVVRDGLAAASDEAKTMLMDGYKTTEEFLTPLYAAQRDEVQGNQSTFAQTAQTQLLNVTGVQLELISAHEPDLSTLEHQHPTANLTGDASVRISIFSSVETPFNPADISVDPQTSSEIGVKMVSQQLLQSLVPAASYGAPPSCKEINEQTLAAALMAAPAASAERFQRRGKPARFLEDHTTAIGPLWVQERLRIKYNDDGMSVQAVAIFSDVDSPFYPGSHYCKLLTPSRALEYVLIDGLRGTQP